MEINLITALRDEGPFILEWVAHYRALGFNRIGMAYHDCTDGSDVFLRALAKEGWIDAYEFEVDSPGGPQHSAYAHLFPKDIVQKADWLAVFDLDEYLNVHIGDHSVNALIKHLDDDVDIACLNWKVFVNDQIDRRDVSHWVKDDFQDAHLRWRKNSGMKSITKDPSRFRGLQNHHPIKFRGEGKIVCSNMNGMKWTPEAYEGRQVLWRVLRHLPEEKIAHDFAQLNHYITKSSAEFVLQCCRGSGFAKDSYDVNKYLKWNEGPTQKDVSVLRYQKHSREIADEILGSSQIRSIQQDVLANYRQRLEFAQRSIQKHMDGLPESFSDIVSDVKRNLKNFEFALAED